MEYCLSIWFINCHSLSNEFSLLKASDILDQMEASRRTLPCSLTWTDPNLVWMEFHTSKPQILLLCSRIASLFASVTKFLFNVWRWLLQHSSLSCASASAQRHSRSASANLKVKRNVLYRAKSLKSTFSGRNITTRFLFCIFTAKTRSPLTFYKII